MGVLPKRGVYRKPRRQDAAQVRVVTHGRSRRSSRTNPVVFGCQPAPDTVTSLWVSGCGRMAAQVAPKSSPPRSRRGIPDGAEGPPGAMLPRPTTGFSLEGSWVQDGGSLPVRRLR